MEEPERHLTYSSSTVPHINGRSNCSRALKLLPVITHETTKLTCKVASAYEIEKNTGH
jgi:hypothetical protein